MKYEIVKTKYQECNFNDNTNKTEALGWKPTRTIKEYIEEQRKKQWK